MSLDLKAELLRHLRASRAGLIWKTDSLSELDLRLPRTPTGTSLLGLVKHCAYIQHGYFVDCLGQSSELELVEVDFDRVRCPTGLPVSDADLAEVRRVPDVFHGE